MRRLIVASTQVSNINMRVAPDQRQLIDRAAEALGKSRTQFILDVAMREATSTLLDQRLFLLDADQWQAFIALLDAPPAPSAELKRLMATPPPWE